MSTPGTLTDPARTDPTAPGYRPGRTLPLRVEAVRQLRRRRTQVMAAILALLPVVMVAAFAIGGEPERRGRVNLMDTATASGLNFAAVCLFVSAGFLLVIPVALFCGDTVASEAGWSSLRYLLAAPVPRARLLWSKLVVALAFSAAAMVLLPLVGLLVGTLAYGWGPSRSPPAAPSRPARRWAGWPSWWRTCTCRSWSPPVWRSGSRPAPTPRSARSAARSA